MTKTERHTDQFQNFTDVFQYAKKILPKKAFVTTQNGTALTYKETLDITARLCGWHSRNNLKRNDRVIIISQDDLAITSLFFSCLRYGLTAVILNPAAGEAELKTLIEAAKPKGIFADEELLQKLALGKSEALTILPISPDGRYKKASFIGKIMGNGADDIKTFPQMIFNEEPAENLENDPLPLDTVAYILFTSGTTSRPKGVEITHGNLLAQMQTFIRQYGYNFHSNLLNILPLHHTDGLTQGPVVSFVAGCSVYRPLHFRINALQELLDSLYRHRITHFIAVPSMLQLIDSLGDHADEAFQNEDFKFVISTAGYLDPNLWKRFEERFKTMIVNVYGLTETVCEALYCGPDGNTRKIGTIGKPVDTEARITDDNGHDVKDGETGELWLKGDHIMKGYFEMPEETVEVLTDEGWFKTGDLCQKDSDGFYNIVGRKKSLVIVGGINVYPDDVANILRSLPGVLDAAVWGEDDQTWGEIVMAAIIPEKGKTPDPNALAEEFLNHAAVEMVPRQIHVVEDFPRGPAGKVVIRDLQDQIAKQTVGKEEQHDGKDMHENIIEIAAHPFQCPSDTLNLDSTAETTKGWNSLAHIEFLLNLEKEYKIKMDPRDILSVRSINDAVHVVETKLSKAA